MPLSVDLSGLQQTVAGQGSWAMGRVDSRDLVPLIQGQRQPF